MYWNLPHHPWRELDRLFRELNLVAEPAAGQRRFPPVNVWSNQDGVILTSELPGVDPAAVQVTVEGNVVTLKGQLPARARQEGETYHRGERPSGEFVREFRLPFRLDPNQVTATLRQGVLDVRLVRLAEDKPRTVTVQAA